LHNDTSLISDIYINNSKMYCQKCRTPLKLDSSLEDLNPAAFDLLVGLFTPLSPFKFTANSNRRLFTATIKEYSGLPTSLSARTKAAL
jgi:hypothetical protein